jgi:hypothetical protein
MIKPSPISTYSSQFLMKEKNHLFSIEDHGSEKVKPKTQVGK